MPFHHCQCILKLDSTTYLPEPSSIFQCCLKHLLAQQPPALPLLTKADLSGLQVPAVQITHDSIRTPSICKARGWISLCITHPYITEPKRAMEGNLAHFYCSWDHLLLRAVNPEQSSTGLGAVEALRGGLSYLSRPPCQKKPLGTYS